MEQTVLMSVIRLDGIFRVRIQSNAGQSKQNQTWETEVESEIERGAITLL